MQTLASIQTQAASLCNTSSSSTRRGSDASRRRALYSSRPTGAAACRRSRRSSVAAAAQQQPQPEPSSALARAASVDLDESGPFMEPFLRTFLLGVGSGALLEGGHIAMQVMNGTFPGVHNFAPLFVADHVTAVASWIALYALEAAAVIGVLKRFNFDNKAAANDLSSMVTLPKRMLPLRLHLFKNFFSAGRKLASKSTPAVAAAQDAAALAAPTSASITVEPAAPAAAAALQAVAAPEAPPKTVAAPAPPTQVQRPPTRAGGINSAVPAPPLERRGGRKQAPGPEKDQAASIAKRTKELQDREGYLKNMWYAAALSSNVGKEPVKTQLCGKELVLFRDAEGKVQATDNTCPHRGAPLSLGWVDHKKDGHSCVVCPYHGWAFDGQGTLRDVPAAANKGEWPKRPLIDSWAVEEKGGFIWVFYGSKALPADERPPIPYVPELDDPSWKPVYEEMEFDCGHFGVFENAIDMAHIHYLHGDSFGNSGKPEIRDMQAISDAHSVTATFTIHNKPVNAFWALFQVPEVHVTARAFLPSTSLVTFELANGLSFTTFVSTCPISANKSINRFALVRKLSSDKTGIFNSRLWDGFARDAMRKIQLEDKDMVEQLRYDQLPAEYSVRADLPQVMFRKLRQQYADMGYVVPTEEYVAPFASTPARDTAQSAAAQAAQQQQQKQQQQQHEQQQ